MGCLERQLPIAVKYLTFSSLYCKGAKGAVHLTQENPMNSTVLKFFQLHVRSYSSPVYRIQIKRVSDLVELFKKYNLNFLSRSIKIRNNYAQQELSLFIP
jgi:hypothetical protein